MADILANAPSSLSDDEIEALIAQLEYVAPSPSIELDFFDESGLIAIIAGTVLMIVVFITTASAGTVFFFGMSRQPFFLQKFVNEKVNRIYMQVYLLLVAPSFGVLSTTSLNRIDAMWGSDAGVWHVRRGMGGIQLGYAVAFLIYFLHYTYMQRFPPFIRNCGAYFGTIGLSFGLTVFIPMRAPTAGGDVGAGLSVIWVLIGFLGYTWFYYFDQKLEDNYEYSIQVKESMRYIMAGDHPDDPHGHITSYYTIEEENVPRDGYSRFHLEHEGNGAYCISVSASGRYLYCNDDLGEDKLVYTADGDEWDDDHMRFYLEQQKDLSFRIRCKASNRYFHCDELGDRLLSTRTQSYDATTVFYLTRHLVHGNWKEDWVTFREIVLFAWFMSLGVIPFSILVASVWPGFAAGLGKNVEDVNRVRQLLVALFLFTFSLIGMHRLQRGKLEVLVPAARTVVAWSFNICFAIPAPLLSLLLEDAGGAQFCSTFLGAYVTTMAWALGWKQIRMLMLKEAQSKLGGGMRVKFFVYLSVFYFLFVAWPVGVIIGIFVGNWVLEGSSEGMMYNIFRGNEGMVTGRSFAVFGFGFVQVAWCVIFRKRALTFLAGYKKDGIRSFLKHGKLPLFIAMFVVWTIVLPVTIAFLGSLTDPYAVSMIGKNDSLQIAYTRENLGGTLLFVVSLLAYFEVHMSHLKVMLGIRIQIVAAITFIGLFASPAALLIRMYREPEAVRILVTLLGMGIQGVVWFSRPSTREGPSIQFIVLKSAEYICLIAAPLSILMGFFFARVVTASTFGTAFTDMVMQDGAGLGAIFATLTAGTIAMSWLLKTQGGWYAEDLETAYKKALEKARAKKVNTKNVKMDESSEKNKKSKIQLEEEEETTSAYIEDETFALTDINNADADTKLGLMEEEQSVFEETKSGPPKEDEVLPSEGAMVEKKENLKKEKKKRRRNGKKYSGKEFKMSVWTLRLNCVLVHLFFLPACSLFVGCWWKLFAELMFGSGKSFYGQSILGGLTMTFGSTTAFHFFHIIFLKRYHIVSKLFLWTYFELAFALSSGVVIAYNQNGDVLQLFLPPVTQSSMIILMLLQIQRKRNNGTWFRDRRSDPISTKFFQNKFVYSGLLGVFTGTPLGVFFGMYMKYFYTPGNQGDAMNAINTLFALEGEVIPAVFGILPCGVLIVQWINRHVVWGARNFIQVILVIIFVVFPFCGLVYLFSHWYIQDFFVIPYACTGIDGFSFCESNQWNVLGFNNYIFRGIAVMFEFGIILVNAFKIYENSLRRFGGGLASMGILFISLFAIQTAAFYLFETISPVSSVTYLSLGISTVLPWIFIFLLKFVSWTVNPKDKFMLLSILLWIVTGVVIPSPSPLTGTKIEEDVNLMYIAACALLMVIALIVSSLVRQFAKQNTMIAISSFWFTIFAPLLAGVPFYLLDAPSDLLESVAYSTALCIAFGVFNLLWALLLACFNALKRFCQPQVSLKLGPTVSLKVLKDPKSLENKAGWIFYVGISFSVMVMLFTYHRIAMSTRQNMILATMSSVPLVVLVLTSKRLHDRCTKIMIISFLVILPLAATVPLLFFFSSDERVVSLCIMLVITFPASAGILAFMQGSRLVVAGFGDRIEGLMTGVNAACCWCLLIPFGVCLPTAMSLPWQTHQLSASIFGTVIGGLAMVAVVFVAITAMGINATFLGMKREKIAKIGTGKLKRAMKRMKVEVSNDVGRNIFDLTCSAGASVSDDHLHEAVVNNEFANYVVDVSKKKPKSTLWEEAELRASSKKGLVRLCKRCKEFGFNVLTAKGNRNFCGQCQLEDIALKEKEKIEKEKALAAASAEERALAKKMENMGNAERLKQAKAAHADATAALASGEYEKALEKSNLAIQMYQEETIMDLYEIRCSASVALEQFPDASADVAALLKAYPKAGKHYVTQGEIFVGLERKEEALDSYVRALELEPERDELEAVIKELQLQIDEDSGVGLNDLIVKYINDVKRSIRRWKERQKQKLRDIRDAVKNAWINVGKKASQLTKKHCGFVGKIATELALMREDFQADWKGFLMGQSKHKIERQQRRQMFLNYHASKIQIKWRKKIYDRQKTKKSSEKAVLQTCFLTYARGGLSIENAQKICKWRVGNHVMALWDDDDEYYPGIIQKMHANGFIVFFTDFGDTNIVRPQNIRPPKDISLNAQFDNINPLVRQDQTRKMILNLLRMSPRDFKTFVIDSGMPMNAAGPAFRAAHKWDMKKQKMSPFHQMNELKNAGKNKRPAVSQVLTIQGFTKGIEELARGLYPGTARTIGIKWILTKHVRQHNPLFDEQRKRALSLQKARLTEMLSRLSGLDASKKVLTRNDYARRIQRCWLGYRQRREQREKMAALMLQMLIRRWVLRRRRRKKRAMAKMNELMGGDADSDEDVEVEDETAPTGGGMSILGIDDDDDEIDSSDEEEEEEKEEEDLSKYDENERIEIIIQRAAIAREKRPNWKKIAEALEPAIIKVKEIVNRPDTMDEDIIVDWTNSGNITACVQVLQDFYLFTSVALRTSQIVPFTEPPGGCAAMAAASPLENFRRRLGSNTTNSTSNVDESADGFGICTILMILDIPKFDFSTQMPDSFMLVFWLACIIACIFPIYSYKSIQMAKSGTLGMNPDGSKVSSCSILGLYFTGLSVISTTLYFGIVKTMLSAFACDWSDISDRVFLLAYPDITCFSVAEPLHILMCLGAVAAIMLYYPLATLLQPQFQFKDKSLDIKYDPSYLILYGQGELLFAGATVFFGADEGNIAYLLLFILIVLCLSLASLTYSMQPCMVPEVNRWRTAVFTACAFSGVGSIYYMYSEQILYSWAIIFGGWILCIFVASGGEVYHRKLKKAEAARKKELLGEKHQAMLARTALLKRLAIEDNKILKGNADFGASGGFWYWGGGTEMEMVESGAASFGSEAGFYYWGPKDFVKHEMEDDEMDSKTKRGRKKKDSKKKGRAKPELKKKPSLKKKTSFKVDLSKLSDEEFEAEMKRQAKEKRERKKAAVQKKLQKELSPR